MYSLMDNYSIIVITLSLLQLLLYQYEEVGYFTNTIIYYYLLVLRITTMLH